jgi:nucleotide-binding universal stress UspA family protein
MATACLTQVSTQQKIGKIAVLSDFSEMSEAALQCAGALAQKYGAEIILAHAYVFPGSAYAAPQVSLVYEAIDHLRLNLENRLLEEIEALHLRDLKYSLLLREGTPSSLLADLNDVDLIVVGTSGATGANKVVLGSNAETLFRHSKIPVLTVGPHCHSSDAGTKETGTVLYATDMSRESTAALSLASFIAETNNAELVLLHVIEDMDAKFSFEKSMARAASLEELQKLAYGAGLKQAPKRIVDFGQADVTILDEARKNHARLIVLGARKAGSLTPVVSRFSSGTAYSVAVHSECPVLTVSRN